MSPPTALALRALGLGDFLTGLPALSLLRRALPDHELVLAAPAVFAPLVPLVAPLDRTDPAGGRGGRPPRIQLVPTGELMPVDRRFAGVDVAVDLHGKGPESRRLLAELHPGRLVGFADPLAGFAGPTWRADEHEVTRWCRLVCEAFGLADPYPGVAGTLGVPAVDAPAGLTLVHPGAAAESRRWPADRFGEVARQLLEAGHRVAITGGEAERPLVQAVSAASGATALLNLSLLELLAVCASACLVVSGDTGVAHIASNYRTPSVLLFGPTSPAAWGPPSDPRHVVLFHGDGRGDPHGSTPDPALLTITVREVLDGVQQATAATADDFRPPVSFAKGRRL